MVDKVAYVEAGVSNDIWPLSSCKTGQSAPVSGGWVRLEFLGGSHDDLKSDSDGLERNRTQILEFLYTCAPQGQRPFVWVLALNTYNGGFHPRFTKFNANQIKKVWTSAQWPTT